MLQAINMLTSSATVGIQNKSSLFNHSQAYQEQIDRFLLRQDDGATNEIPLIDDEDTDVATSADFPEPIIDPVPLPPLEPEIVPLPLPAPEIIEEVEEDVWQESRHCHRPNSLRTCRPRQNSCPDRQARRPGRFIQESCNHAPGQRHGPNK